MRLLRYGPFVALAGAAAWAALRPAEPPAPLRPAQTSPSPSERDKTAPAPVAPPSSNAEGVTPVTPPSAPEVEPSEEDPSGETTDNAVPAASDSASALEQARQKLARLTQSGRSPGSWQRSAGALRDAVATAAREQRLSATVSTLDCYAAGCTFSITHAGESDVARLEQALFAAPAFASWSGSTFHGVPVPRVGAYETLWILEPNGAS